MKWNQWSSAIGMGLLITLQTNLIGSEWISFEGMLVPENWVPKLEKSPANETVPDLSLEQKTYLEFKVRKNFSPEKIEPLTKKSENYPERIQEIVERFLPDNPLVIQKKGEALRDENSKVGPPITISDSNREHPKPLEVVEDFGEPKIIDKIEGILIDAEEPTVEEAREKFMNFKKGLISKTTPLPQPIAPFIASPERQTAPQSSLSQKVRMAFDPEVAPEKNPEEDQAVSLRLKELKQRYLGKQAPMEK